MSQVNITLSKETLKELMLGDRDEVFHLTEICKKRPRTSNSLESANQELRRRERVTRIFQIRPVMNAYLVVS